VCLTPLRLFSPTSRLFAVSLLFCANAPVGRDEQPQLIALATRRLRQDPRAPLPTGAFSPPARAAALRRLSSRRDPAYWHRHFTLFLLPGVNPPTPASPAVGPLPLLISVLYTRSDRNSLWPWSLLPGRRNSPLACLVSSKEKRPPRKGDLLYPES